MAHRQERQPETTRVPVGDKLPPYELDLRGVDQSAIDRARNFAAQNGGLSSAPPGDTAYRGITGAVPGVLPAAMAAVDSATSDVGPLAFLNDPQIAGQIGRMLGVATMDGIRNAVTPPGGPSGPGGPGGGLSMPGVDQYIADSIAPYQQLLGSYNQEERNMLDALNQMFLTQNTQLDELGDRGTGEINEAATIADTKLGSVAEAQAKASQLIRDDAQTMIDSVNRSRSQSVRAMMRATIAGGGDASRVAGAVAEGAGRLAREQSAGVDHQAERQDIAASIIGTAEEASDLIAQSATSTLTNNMTAARNALDIEKLKQETELKAQFAQQRRELEFQIAQTALQARREYEAQLMAARSRGGGGGGGGGFDGAPSGFEMWSADHVAGVVPGVDPMTLLAFDELGGAGRYLDMKMDPPSEDDFWRNYAATAPLSEVYQARTPYDVDPVTGQPADPLHASRYIEDDYRRAQIDQIFRGRTAAGEQRVRDAIRDFF